MTPDPNDRDEDALRALFDASAEEPDAALLTRLSARAADIPQQVGARRWRAPGWAWAPGLGGLAVAAGVALFAWGPSGSEGSGNQLSVQHADVGVTTLAPAAADERRPSAGSSVAPIGAIPAQTVAAPEVEAVGWADEDSELDAWHGPLDEEELDAWLYATAELVNERP